MSREITRISSVLRLSREGASHLGGAGSCRQPGSTKRSRLRARPSSFRDVSESPVIRWPRPSDAAAIADVHIASWRSAYRGLLPQALLDTLSTSEFTDRWRHQLADRRRTTLVAEVANRVVGFASFGVSRDPDANAGTGELFGLYTATDVWGSSVGRLLHEAVVIELDAGFQQSTLWVLEANARARAFYEKNGWLADGTIKDSNRGGETQQEVRYRRQQRQRQNRRYKAIDSDDVIA